jgi:hypothetical protein
MTQAFIRLAERTNAELEIVRGTYHNFTRRSKGVAVGKSMFFKHEYGTDYLYLYKRHGKIFQHKVDCNAVTLSYERLPYLISCMELMVLNYGGDPKVLETFIMENRDVYDEAVAAGDLSEINKMVIFNYYMRGAVELPKEFFDIKQPTKDITILTSKFIF